MRKSDLPALSRIYARVYRDYHGERWTQRPAYRLLAHWFKRQPDLAFVAERDGKPVGAFLSGIKPWWGGNHLCDGEIFVDSAYQKRGIGTLLAKAMYAAAVKKYNAAFFQTVTFRKSKPPLAWYKAQGFEPERELVLIAGDLQKALKRLEKM